jgi:hypothetical protein
MNSGNGKRKNVKGNLNKKFNDAAKKVRSMSKGVKIATLTNFPKK